MAPKLDVLSSFKISLACDFASNVFILKYLQTDELNLHRPGVRYAYALHQPMTPEIRLLGCADVLVAMVRSCMLFQHLLERQYLEDQR